MSASTETPLATAAVVRSSKSAAALPAFPRATICDSRESVSFKSTWARCMSEMFSPPKIDFTPPMALSTRLASEGSKATRKASPIFLIDEFMRLS